MRFPWFRSCCPVERYAKAWVEGRLRWLAKQFGLQVFARRAVILPLDEFFPDVYDGSDHSVRQLLDRVCGYMGVDPALVDLEIFTDRNPLWLVNERGQPLPGAAGLYERGVGRPVVHLESSQFDHPMDLVGTIAHELAHHRLLGERRIRDGVFDNELLTDLTVVFHGLGIFLANSPRFWESHLTTWPGTDVRRSEYMTLPMYGYALAHAAWFRDEQKPAWAKYLRADARASFKQALRYLWETGDSTFTPQHAGSQRTRAEVRRKR